MKDLKHLIYFEKLLEDTHNELIRDAKKDGKLMLGYTCYHMPEVVLNVDKCISIRMRAPNTGAMDVASYYMSNYTCEFCRAILERAFEGGFNFLDAFCSVDACAMMNRMSENLELLNLVDNKKFFVTHADIPYKVEDYSIEHYVVQIRKRVLEPLHSVYGVDISDNALRAAVEIHNEVCKIIAELSEFRKLENPPITGYEFHVLTMVTYSCPKYLLLDKLKETLEEVKNRQVDDNPWYRARVVLAGSEVDDLTFTKLVEDCGVMVVADRYCFGSVPGREVMELNDKEDVLTQICRHYLCTSECPRFMSKEKVDQRSKTVDRLVREFNAEGIIYEQIKFCDFWGFERVLASHVLNADFGHNVLSIDRPYVSRMSGQLKTRIQAFVESLEIKRIQREGKGA